MRFHNYESVASGSPAAAATSASGIRIVVFRLRHHVRSQPQGAERCDGRDIEDDPHGRSPLRKPAVQVSRRELLAARVIELGLALLLQGNRSSVIFPHHSPLHFRRSPSPADRTDSLCRIVIDHAVFFPASEPQCSSRKGSRLTQAERWTPQCSMDASSRDKASSLAIGHNSRH